MAYSFFCASYTSYSNHEQKLPYHDTFCVGSVDCVRANVLLIHCYILGGKHSLKPAINYAAVATKDYYASWGISRACPALGARRRSEVEFMDLSKGIYHSREYMQLIHKW